MRARIAFVVILVASLSGSARIADAQTGEFAGQVPGPIVRQAWKIQDQLQSIRSGTSVKSPSHTARSLGDPSAAKPQGSVTATNGAKTKE
jgi:hypothetical protein